MKYPEVRNGEIITKKTKITTVIIVSSAEKPTKTPGLKMVSQV